MWSLLVSIIWSVNSSSTQAHNCHTLDWQTLAVLAFTAVSHPSNNLTSQHSNYPAFWHIHCTEAASHCSPKPGQSPSQGDITCHDNLPTYSGVPIISLSSSLLFIILERPKSTILMSPRGDLLVSRIFWGWKTKDNDFQDHPNLMPMTPYCINILYHK